VLFVAQRDGMPRACHRARQVAPDRAIRSLPIAIMAVRSSSQG